MTDQAIRLYSRPSRLPVDELAPEHESIDDELQQWGIWSRERRRRMKCRSVEHEYRPRNGNQNGWEYEPPANTPAQILNPRMIVVDHAVLAVPAGHREVLKLHYVALLSASMICRQRHIHAPDFGRWLHDARCMVVNILRRMGS